MKKNCLLLGGSGFIGQNLARYLKNKGYNVTIYCRSVKSEDELLNVKYIKKDFFKDDNLEDSIIGNDVIIHLISSVTPATSMVKPQDCYRNDLIKTIDLLEAARRNKVKRVIFISSGGTVYGNYFAEKYSEDMPTYPINHYGIMKLSIEEICLMYNKVYGMDNLILRVSNPYGVGQNPNKNLGAISVFTKKILNEESIEIYGDGNITRDYIYIDDVVKIIEKAIEYKSSNEIIPIFNVGSGVGRTLNELIEVIGRLLHKKPYVRYIESRQIDVKRNVLDMMKCMKELEVKIDYDIEKGIMEYINQIK